jgi:site-specific DNA-methyltransferase (adenine-specific)
MCQRRLRPRASYSLASTQQVVQQGPGNRFLNQVVQGDCFQLLSDLEDDSYDLIVTSTPDTEQCPDYPGIPVDVFPATIVKFMKMVWPKLKEDGSVFIVIRAHVEGGQVSDHVYRTILAVREAGWFQPDEIIWHKPDGPPCGSIDRPRRNFEHVLWFSRSKKPYVDLTACGKPSKCIGLEGSNRHGNIHGTSAPLDGIARITDVITAHVGETDKDIEHPAMCPRTLIRPIIETYSRPGSSVLDPFSGSGTTALCAQELGRNYTGFDIKKAYVDLANRRLENERRHS